MRKRTTAQMEPPTLSSLHPISITSFLKIFKLTCDTSEVHRGASMWLFYVFMERSCSLCYARLSADSRG